VQQAGLSEDPSPGSNRHVPVLMSGVGHRGGDTWLPGVIVGVLETDAIWSGGMRAETGLATPCPFSTYPL
jgi:hypothetical protein